MNCLSQYNILRTIADPTIARTPHGKEVTMIVAEQFWWGNDTRAPLSL